MHNNEPLRALFVTAEAYAYGRCRGECEIVVPEEFAKAYVETWKVWQKENTEDLPFMFPDDFWSLYVRQVEAV